ncbi:MAG: copper resistance protein CopA [Oceanospirillaceae bacterium]|nr:copper resistance protein CopA [Oceanospirillaceae bacterium]MBT12222.1 copper resistance protein CopA [Oceanospirillaceae bacterium]|tara:strand:- start:3555 stop:5381 length:1827 start_codon:yes stop_codon:yes gene_type:complete
MSKHFELPRLNRRRFVQGLAAGGILAGMPSLGRAASAGHTQHGTAPVLSGKTIDLVIDETLVNFTGNIRRATSINGSIPAPTLRLREGDTVTIRVTNRMSVPTSIHWHGIILPHDMDGVPGLSYRGIAPGETFVYRFPLQQTGTYWYHSHTGFQEMTGMYGALIVEPRDGANTEADRAHIIQLSDWTDDDPMAVFARLKTQADVYNYNQPTMAGFFDDISALGFTSALQKRRMWNHMRMNPTDLADVSGSVLTYLMNGTTPAGNWTGLFKRGESVRLHFINAASNSFYDVRIPGLKMTVVEADGQAVEPVSVDEFRFGPGETYDVIVKPSDDAHTIFAQSMDRSGYARGTLAVQQGLSAPVPDTDPVDWLGMQDMMGNMQHGAHGGMHDMPGMDHSQMDASHMDHAQMNHTEPMNGMPVNPLARPSQTVRHASTETGGKVDMLVDTPRTNLDDPGVGLRALSQKGRRPAGHKVLTHSDLRSRQGVLDDKRVPGREMELHLTGNMERYSWSFDGVEFGDSTPVAMKRGERVRIILQNDTMMTHPMHLHGMWSDLETSTGELLARRHTIQVQPAQRISFLTTPEEVGRWAWHCHLAFHMDAGMFREVAVV